MRTSESIGGLAAALAKAQGAFRPIVKDRTVKVRTRAGGEYVFSYAPLESIMSAVRPALAENGLFLTQALSSEGGQDAIETTVVHASGEWMANRTPVLVMEQGPQAYGSAITYARRYGVTTLLCLVADDDDDANGAEGNSAAPAPKASRKAPTPPPAAITAEQAAGLREQLAAVGGDEAAFTRFLGVDSLEALPAARLEAAASAIASKRRAQARTEPATVGS